MNKKQTYTFSIAVILLCCFFSCKPKQAASTSNTKNTGSNEDKVRFQSTFYNACKEKMLGNSELALNQFRECLKYDPTSAVVKYEMANIYRFTGFNDEALKFAKEAAIGDPKNEWFQLLYIDCLHNKRQYADALAAYEKLIKTSPNKPEYYEGMAQEAMFANKPDKAIKAYSDIESKFGRDEDIALRKITLLKQLRKYDEAEREIKLLIKDFPNQPQYYTYLAEIYQETGQPEKAFTTYQDVLKTDPNNPYIHLALADYYRQQKKDSLFFTEVKIAFASEDLDIDNKMKIMVSYYDMTEMFPNYKPKAYELLDVLLKVHPKDPKAWAVNGDFLYRDKKLPEAKASFEKVLEFDKSRYAIWSQLMLCETDMNDFTSLEKHSAEAIDFFPNMPNPYFFNGLANLKLKDYKKAIQSFVDGQEFVYENVPLQLQFLTYLAETYNADKQYEKSDKAFDDALAIDPNDPMVMNNYAYYLSIRKEKLEKAAKLSARTIELQPGSVSYMDAYAWILYQQGKYADAKTWLDKALPKGGDNRAAILEHYGDVLFKLNDEKGAYEYWKKAKEKGGNSDLLNKKILEGKLYE